MFLISVLYSVCLCLSQCFIAFFFVLLRYCYYVLSTSHLYPSRILFLDAITSCILHWLCVGHAIDHCGWFSLHCISEWAFYLINVYCGHSLMIELVWSNYVYILYSVYKLDRTLLAHVHTMYSTCHKLNESFVCVWVFQVTGIYVQVLHNF